MTHALHLKQRDYALARLRLACRPMEPGASGLLPYTVTNAVTVLVYPNTCIMC
jgi:hypothetical protein